MTTQTEEQTMEEQPLPHLASRPDNYQRAFRMFRGDVFVYLTDTMGIQPDAATPEQIRDAIQHVGIGYYVAGYGQAPETIS